MTSRYADLTGEEAMAARRARADFDQVRALLKVADEQHAAIVDAGYPRGSAQALANTYLVAADAAEESDFTAWARDLRGDARRALLVGWARRKWPRDDIHLQNIIRLTAPRGREITQFTIRRSHSPLYAGRWASTWVDVAMDRRGRVRILQERR